MYDTIGERPMFEGCKEPDWEKEYEIANNQTKIIKVFKDALIAFIDVVGMHTARRDGRNFLAELLGTVEIDILQRDKNLERLAKKIEG